MAYTLEGEFDREFGTTPRNPPQGGHSGLFGIRGVGRDILGVLGDAFLMQAGRDPLYRMTRRQEKTGDALADFTNDPLGAIQNLAQMGHGKEANELLDSMTKRANDTLKATAAAQADRSLASGREADAARKQLVPVLGMLDASNEMTYPAILDQINRYTKAKGIELPFELPSNYDKDQIAGLVGYGIDPEERMKADALERYRTAQTILDGGKLRVDAAKLRANVADDTADNFNAAANTRLEGVRVTNQANKNVTDARREARQAAGSEKASPKRGTPSLPNPSPARTIRGKNGEVYVSNGKKWTLVE